MSTGRWVKWIVLLVVATLLVGVAALGWVQNTDQLVSLRLDFGPMVGAYVMQPAVPALAVVAGGAGIAFVLGFVAGVAAWPRARGEDPAEDAYGG